MPPHDRALDDINGIPARFASGETPEPPCPCCGHVRSVKPLTEVVAPPRREPYGWIANFFPPGRHLDPELRSIALVPSGRRTIARTLRPPRPPWTMGQAVDRRLTLVIDFAFLALGLFLIGRLIRAVEFEGLAALLAILAFVLALWLIVALATGQLRRLNGREQDRYDRALRRWRALLYCEDCSHVFRADGRGYLAPQAVHAYLERDGPDTIATQADA